MMQSMSIFYINNKNLFLRDVISMYNLYLFLYLTLERFYKEGYLNCEMNIGQTLGSPSNVDMVVCGNQGVGCPWGSARVDDLFSPWLLKTAKATSTT